MQYLYFLFLPRFVICIWTRRIEIHVNFQAFICHSHYSASQVIPELFCVSDNFISFEIGLTVVEEERKILQNIHANIHMSYEHFFALLCPLGQNPFPTLQPFLIFFFCLYTSRSTWRCKLWWFAIFAFSSNLPIYMCYCLRFLIRTFPLLFKNLFSTVWILFILLLTHVLT
jgi:hypothetical protein